MTGLERRRAAGAVVVLCLPAVLLTSPAEAQDVSIVISLPTVVEGEPDSQHLLATQDVPDELVGSTCSARAQAENQSSVHPGNDLVIASGGDQIVLEDVEREPGAVTVAQGSLVVGDQVTATLLMGPDGTFSAGMRVELRCEPTTTSTTTTTIPETTETTEGDTTTTAGDTTTTQTVMGETTSSTSATTTTAVPATGTEGDTTTTASPPTPDSTLPFTGTGANMLGGVALAALLAGVGLMFLTQRAGGRRSVYLETEVEGVRVTLLRRGG